MNWLKKIKTHAISCRFFDEQIYAQVLSEIENGQRRDGLWAKALAHSDGSNEKAKSLYIKYRVKSIKDEIILATKREEPETRQEHSQENTSTETSGNWNSNDESWEKSNVWIHILVFVIATLLILPLILGA